MHPKLLAFLAISLLLLGCTFATNPAPGPLEQELHTSWVQENWAAVGITIVLATLFFLAIVYMVAEALNSRELHVWVITEFFQAAVSILIIIMLLMLFALLSQLTGSLINLQDPTTPPCTTSECQFEIVQRYLVNPDPTNPGLRDIALMFAEHSSLSAVHAISKSTFKISLVAVDLIPFLFSGYSMRPYAGMSIYSDRHMLIADYAVRMAASINAQSIFLDYVATGLVPLLLIAGVILRSIFFLRRIGGLLIAIAIALFTIYPLTYILFQYTYPVRLDVDATMPGGVDSLAGCNPDELYADYPVQIEDMCYSMCQNHPNPASDLPLFAHDSCKNVCHNYCFDHTDPAECERRCSAGLSEYIFLCSILDAEGDGVYECHEYVMAETGGDAEFESYLYKEHAKNYLAVNHPGIASCKDLVIEVADPYAAVGQCSVLNAEGDVVTCPSNFQADCRVTYRQLNELPDGTFQTTTDPDHPYSSDAGFAYRYPDYFNEVLPFLPNQCKANEDVVAACLTCTSVDCVKADASDPICQSNPECLDCANDPSCVNICNANPNCLYCKTTATEAQRLTSLPDPEMQKRCLESDVQQSGIIPPIDSDLYGVSGDISGIAKLLVAGIVLPIFNIVITITFVKILSPVLGGDVDIPGVMRLI